MKTFRYLIAGIFSIIFILSGHAQERTCQCQVVFDELIEKLEANYIGLKLNQSNKFMEGYEKNKLKTKKLVTKAKPEECTGILQDFLSYLKDGHLFVFEKPVYSESELSSYKKTIKANRIDLNKIEAISSAKFSNSLIGKWTDGTSEIIIIEENKAFNAYILSTSDSVMMPGELKASFVPSKKGFKGVLYSYRYAPKYFESQLYKESTLLNLGGGVLWGRTDSHLARETSMINKQDVTLPFIQKIDERNVLFSIPSFLIDKNVFNKYLIDNLDILSNAENLIFDIRGNTGGNALYMTFIDAYADRPLPSSQGLVLASEETKFYFERQAKYDSIIFQPVVDAINNHMGKIVDGPAYPKKIFTPFPTKIKNVAILTDEGCMSAAESFILHSKASSSKVKTFGSATAGVIDYTSVNVIKLNAGNQNIYFGYPTSTYHKKIPADGFNKTGIVPDVIINDNVDDKIGFIIKYYKQ